MTAEIYTLIGELKGLIFINTKFRPAKIIRIKGFIPININFGPIKFDKTKKTDSDKISINFRKNNLRALADILEKKRN